MSQNLDMFSPSFVQREIDAINEKWREIKKAASARTKRWRSFTGSTSIPISGEASENSWASSAPTTAIQSLFPTLIF